MVWGYIGGLVEDISDIINTSAISTQLASLQLILLGMLSLFILLKGYMILAGKTQEPIKDLIWDLVIKLLVITIPFSPAWITLIGDAVNGLVEWAGGDVSLYDRLDILNTEVTKIGAAMEDMDGSFEFTGFFCQLYVIFSNNVVSLFSIGIIIATSIALKFLLMVSPFMIFANFYSWSKGLFEGWLKLVLNIVLINLFIGVSFNILSDEYKKVIDQSLKNVESGTIGIVSIANDIFFVSMIVTLLVLMSVYIATQLTRISIGMLPASTALQGASNGASVARSAGSAGASTINRVSNASTAIGNRFSKR